MQIEILIIEDNNLERKLYKRILSSEGYIVNEAVDLRTARKLIRTRSIHIVILDVNLPDGNGLDFISEIKLNLPRAEIIVFTSEGKIEDSVKSIKTGALDYLIKIDTPMRLLGMVQRAKEIIYDNEFNEPETPKNDKDKGFARIIGTSSAIQMAKDMALKVANTNVNVLLLGETGVGKDLFAEEIHHYSNRRSYAFIAVNCSSFGKEMLESELFGYKAGAFTGAMKDKKGLFEVAHKGTLFLDEIGEMSLDMQTKLLRVIQNQSFIKLGDTKKTAVNCRIIAATNIKLVEAVKNGTFREDLYYRISSFTIKIPSLRERISDVPLLVKHFMKILPIRLDLPAPKLSDYFVKTLMQHPWNGNVRELINVLERVIILNEEDVLETQVNEVTETLKLIENKSKSLEKIKLDHILKVLQNCGGNKRAAARNLGISIATLYRKLDSI